MSKVPILSYEQIIAALKRDGWVVIRQKGSHIRLGKQTENGILKLTVPAHRSVKKTTLAQILKQAGMEIERFLDLL